MAQAARQFGEALALWRGEALEDVPAAALHRRHGERLAQARLSALQGRIEAELHLASHPGLVAEVQELEAAHPFRESIVSLLMRVLYAEGRRSDALEVYRRCRSRFTEEMGIEPGPELQDLHRRVLADDPGLITHRPQAAVPSAAAAASEAVICNLPRDVADFTGRRSEADRVLAFTDRSPAHAARILVIDGMAGVGKSALAVHMAHRLAERFPDGRIHIDLTGFTPGRAPLEPGVALARLLRAIGVSQADVPASTDERAALWRTLTATGRYLILLDNAADATQVRELLPGSPGCMVVVTSRQRMPTLAGVEAMSLTALDRDDAHALLARICGTERIAAEPDAAEEILRLCDRLPLAVRIAAARLAHRPAWTVAHLLRRMRECISPLPELVVQDQSVSAAFAVSYQALSEDERRLFRLAGLHPGRSLSLHALAALADVPLSRADDVAAELYDHHLLAEPAPARYAFHDLLRHHAGELAVREEPEAAVNAALLRLFSLYNHTAATAMDLLYPYEAYRRPHPPAPSTPAIDLTTADAARAWLDDDLADLIAVGTHPAASISHHCVELSAILWRHLDRTGHIGESIVLHTAAVESAKAAGDQAGLAASATNLAGSFWHTGRFHEALDIYHEALAGFRAVDDHAGASRVLSNLGATYGQLGRFPEAIEQLTAAMEMYEAAGDRAGRVAVLSNLGAICELTGDLAKAEDLHRQALAAAREVGEHTVEGRILTNLGMTLDRLGRTEEAAEMLNQAYAMAFAAGDKSRQIAVLHALGDLERPADPAKSLARHQEALELSVETGDEASRAAGLLRIGDDHQALGETALARTYWEQSLELYTRLSAASHVEKVRSRLEPTGSG